MVGKTSFIRHFVQGGESFSQEYSPTISLDPYKKSVMLTGELVDLTVWDISGFSGPNRGQQNPNDFMTVRPPQSTKNIPPKLWRLHDRAGNVEARAFTSSALGAIVLFDATQGEKGLVTALAWKLWFEQASANEGNYQVSEGGFTHPHHHIFGIDARFPNSTKFPIQVSIPIMLVGNKVDLCAEGSLSTETIETFARDNGRLAGVDPLPLPRPVSLQPGDERFAELPPLTSTSLRICELDDGVGRFGSQRKRLLRAARLSGLRDGL